MFLCVYRQRLGSHGTQPTDLSAFQTRQDLNCSESWVWLLFDSGLSRKWSMVQVSCKPNWNRLMFWICIKWKLLIQSFFHYQIEDSEIYATINQRDGMVSFHDSPEKYNSPRMLKKLDEEVLKINKKDKARLKCENFNLLLIMLQFMSKTCYLGPDIIPGNVSVVIMVA